MELKRFSLGVRFDFMGMFTGDEMEKRVFEELFSVLTLSDLEGLNIYGGLDLSDSSAEKPYLVVIDNMGLKVGRRIYQKISQDAAIDMYLAHNRPFLEKNRLLHIDGLAYFGEVNKNGRVTGGDKDCFGLTVPKKHGSKRPVGKGIRILLAPDSFKGTLTSTEAIKHLTVAARRHFQGVKLVPVPIADGGEGTVDALVTACAGDIHAATVQNPLGEKAKAKYGVLNGRTAIIEMAQASGLTLIEKDNRDLMKASSFGTGELIRRALDEGLRDILIGLGGSATNDCGMGCARALGVKFFDAENNELKGCGEDLIKVEKIDLEFSHPALRDAVFTIMCDVDNPLLGEKGATHIYGPQKQAVCDRAQLDELEKGMEHFARLLAKATGRDVLQTPGAGAAGGMGAMLMALTGAESKRGIDALLDAIEFEKLLNGVALVVTGEGRVDAQSVEYGKAVAGIMKRCELRRIPVAIITGGMGDNARDICTLANASIMTCINAPMTAQTAEADALKLFDDAADRMFRFIRMGRDVEKIGAPKPPRKYSPIQVVMRLKAKEREREKKKKRR